MRVKVLRTYRDKYSHQLHKKNTKIEVTEERFEELNSTSLGVFVEELTVDDEKTNISEEIEVKNDVITDENESKTDQKPSKKGKK